MSIFSRFISRCCFLRSETSTLKETIRIQKAIISDLSQANKELEEDVDRLENLLFERKWCSKIATSTLAKEAELTPGGLEGGLAAQSSFNRC